MIFPIIQQLEFRFIGFFDYKIIPGNIGLIEEKFSYSDYYENNKAYFNQKYYHNWLQTLYPCEEKLHEIGIPLVKGNHLILKDAESLGRQTILSKKKEYTFTISDIEIYLFRENLGIFSIDVLLQEDDWFFDKISDFASAARNVTSNPLLEINNPFIKILETSVLNYFVPDITKWISYNPHFKLFLNIDVVENFTGEKVMDHLLFELATVSPIGSSSSESLYSPTDSYFSELLDNNTIHLFNNWKAICLSDSLVRLSVNLKSVDGHNLWKNDYYSIYIFTLFIRLYLYRTNRLLAETLDIKTSASTRNEYIGFMNDFDLTQISYKFLPNLIYQKLMYSLDIKDELNKLDQKIDRIDTYINEFQQKRIDVFIRYLVAITIFPISWEGSELLSLLLFNEDHHKYQRIIAVILFGSLILLGILFYYIVGRKDSVYVKKSDLQ